MGKFEKLIDQATQKDFAKIGTPKEVLAKCAKFIDDNVKHNVMRLSITQVTDQYDAYCDANNLPIELEYDDFTSLWDFKPFITEVSKMKQRELESTLAAKELSVAEEADKSGDIEKFSKLVSQGSGNSSGDTNFIYGVSHDSKSYPPLRINCPYCGNKFFRDDADIVYKEDVVDKKSEEWL